MLYVKLTLIKMTFLLPKQLRDLKKIEKRKGVLNFIETVGLSKEKLKDKFAEGGQHNLYHYDQDKVLKIAKPDLLHFIFGIHSKDEVINENKLIQKYFPANTVKTEVLLSDSYPYYLILQDKVENYDHLSSYNLKKYKEKLLEILKFNEKLEKKGYSIDFLGRHGLKETFLLSIKKKKLFIVLYNLIVSNKEIKIIDFNLLRISQKTEKNWFKRKRFQLLNNLYKKFIYFTISKLSLLYTFDITILKIA